MSPYRPSADDLLFGAQPEKNDGHCRQQLSAMLDGALAPDQERFLLRRLQHDRALGQCWERWQIYGDLMRGHAHALLPPDFAARVSAAVQADGNGGAYPHAASPSAARGRLRRWGSGAALAASVAMVGFFAGRQFGAHDVAPSEPAGAIALSAPQTPSPKAPAASTPVPFGIGGAEQADGAGAADAATAGVMLIAAAPASAKRLANDRKRIAQAAHAPVARSVTTPDAAPAAVATVAPAEVSRTAAASVAPAFAESSPAFSLPPANDALAPRPWPRALLGTGGDGAFRVDYGRAAEALPPHFQPRLQAGSAAPPSQPDVQDPPATPSQ